MTTILLRPQSLLNQAFRRSLRITDHAIRPTKHRKLSATLIGSKQVAQLALASNYDRRTSQLRGRNQRQVGVVSQTRARSQSQIRRR